MKAKLGGLQEEMARVMNENTQLKLQAESVMKNKLDEVHEEMARTLHERSISS